MRAAQGGHEACVGLLLPESDLNVKSEDGQAASELAREEGCERIASMIESYALAMSEMADVARISARAAQKKTS